jgi:hypothetical protein
MDHLHGNNSFLELEQSCVPNSTTCSTNSTTKLLHGGVRRAELEKRQRSSPKHPHRLQNMDNSSVGVALRCATLLRQNTASILWVAEAPFCSFLYMALFAWTYQPYRFSEITVFFSRNKSVSTSVSTIFSISRTGPIYVFPSRILQCNTSGRELCVCYYLFKLFIVKPIYLSWSSQLNASAYILLYLY